MLIFRENSDILEFLLEKLPLEQNGDAMTWLSNSPDESLGFILEDNGYDVWLASVRGTTYSNGHTSLSPSDLEYWNWSWDELVAYDLPATFKYVYDQTGQKLHYVGHSLLELKEFQGFTKGLFHFGDDRCHASLRIGCDIRNMAAGLRNSY